MFALGNWTFLEWCGLFHRFSCFANYYKNYVNKKGQEVNIDITILPICVWRYVEFSYTEIFQETRFAAGIGLIHIAIWRK